MTDRKKIDAAFWDWMIIAFLAGALIGAGTFYFLSLVTMDVWISMPV